MMEQEKYLLDDICTQQEFIRGILKRLKDVDFYTVQHCIRVGKMTNLLCEHLSESQNVKRLAHIAGYTHDIGKIDIPHNILNKKEKLTEEEWGCIKNHTKVGADIFGQSNYHTVGNIVLMHHERWDGKGYRGVKGEDIPREARIIAVCDSIDAMISNRVYQKALSHEKCKEEISINIGKMYDPEVARAALEIFDELVNTKHTYDSYIA